jgi:hypothetical protein
MHFEYELAHVFRRTGLSQQSLPKSNDALILLYSVIDTTYWISRTHTGSNDEGMKLYDDISLYASCMYIDLHNLMVESTTK